VLIGKYEETTRKTYRSRLEDNINTDLKETEWKRYKLDSSGSRYRPVAGSREHGNERLGSIIKCLGFLD
jgi:hypothetical protein